MKAVTQITKVYSIQNQDRRTLKEKTGKQGNARKLCKKYRGHIKHTCLWLLTGDLKAETESEITAAQTK
jgi:hypothetical protein